MKAKIERWHRAAAFAAVAGRGELEQERNACAARWIERGGQLSGCLPNTQREFNAVAQAMASAYERGLSEALIEPERAEALPAVCAHCGARMVDMRTFALCPKCDSDLIGTGRDQQGGGE